MIKAIESFFSTALLLRLAQLFGLFSLAAGALLAWDYCASLNAAQMRDSQALVQPLAQLAADPANEQLKRHIRALDQDLRIKFFKRQDFAQRGAWLLAFCLSVFLLCAKGVAARRSKQAWPRFLLIPKDAAGGAPLEPLGAKARVAVATLGLCFICGSALLLTTTADRLAEAASHDTNTAINNKPQQPEAAPLPGPEEYKKNWPRFRGPDGSGISAFANAPASWNGKTGQNILWKAAVALPGVNSPAVWGQRIFLTGADEKNREVYCFDTAGSLLWRQPVISNAAEPPSVSVESTGYAAPSAATDGLRVYAIFATGDVACFDFDGKPQWTMHLGLPENIYGHASSLLTWRHLLLIQFDQGGADEGKSKLLAVNGATGKKVWTATRDVGSSWCTPIIFEGKSGTQLATCAKPFAIAYAPDSGAELWRAECMAEDPACSPVFSGGLLYAVNCNTRLTALRVDGKGDVSKTGTAWTAGDGLPDTCSPLCDGQRVYILKSEGLLTCYDAASGKKLWDRDFETSFTASPSLAGNRIYLTSTEGLTIMLEAANELKELGRAKLDEKVNTSLAFHDGRIYIRGEKNLYAIGGAPK